mmetsp:Transcript_117541/g.337234  ORF Transcript_117541/g.337234 Transcript_117541/m.337234 type:complete len:254 (-) Transcript_117541:369-1130(-)
MGCIVLRGLRLLHVFLVACLGAWLGVLVFVGHLRDDPDNDRGDEEVVQHLDHQGEHGRPNLIDQLVRAVFENAVPCEADGEAEIGQVMQHPRNEAVALVANIVEGPSEARSHLHNNEDGRDDQGSDECGQERVPCVFQKRLDKILPPPSGKHRLANLHQAQLVCHEASMISVVDLVADPRRVQEPVHQRHTHQHEDCVQCAGHDVDHRGVIDEILEDFVEREAGCFRCDPAGDRGHAHLAKLLEGVDVRRLIL